MIQEDVRLREDVADPAQRAAAGVMSLVAALGALAGAGSGLSGVAGAVAQTGQAAATATAQVRGASAVAVAEARAAGQAAGAAARASAAEQAAAAKVAVASIKSEADARKEASANVNARNAAMAKMIAAQAAADAKLRLAAEQNAAKLVQIEAKKAGDIEKIRVREKARAEALSRELPRRDQGVRDRLDALMGQLGGNNADVLNSIDGQLGGVIGKFKELGTAGGIAAAAVAASLALIAGAAAYLGAITGVVAKVGEMSMAASDAKASLLGKLSALTGSADAARELSDAIDEVAKKTPVSGDRLEAFARSAAAAGLSGDKLKGTMQALARVEGVAGAAAADRMQELVQKIGAKGKMIVPEAEALKGTGITIDALYQKIADRIGVGKDKVEGLLKAGKVSVEEGIDALNAAIEGKFGKGSDRAMLRFGVQIAKLREAFDNLIEDVDWTPLQVAMRDVLSVFDDSTESGAKLKALVTDFFGTVAALAAKAGPYIKAFIEGAIDGLAGMWEGAKAAFSTLSELIGADPNASSIEKWRMIGELVAKLVVYGGGAATAILGVVAALVTLAALPIVAPIVLLVTALTWVAGKAGAVAGAFSNASTGMKIFGTVAAIALFPVAAPFLAILAVIKAVGAAIDWLKGKFSSLGSTSIPMPQVTGTAGAAGAPPANDNGGGAAPVGDAIASPRSGGAAAGAGGGRSVVFNVSAPVTIAVPPGGNAAQAGREAADGFWLRVRELAEVAA